MAESILNEQRQSKISLLFDKFAESTKSSQINWRSTISKLLSIVMVLMIMLTLFNTVMFFMPAHSKATPSQTVSPAQPNDAALYQKIPQWHLFGLSEGNALVVTHLSLTLKGVLMDVSGKQSLAIIDTPDGNEKIYHAGDALPGGAVIYSIKAHEVIIRYLGNMERLPLAASTDNNANSNNQSNTSDDNNSNTTPDYSAPNAIPGVQNYINLLKRFKNLND